MTTQTHTQPDTARVYRAMSKRELISVASAFAGDLERNESALGDAQRAIDFITGRLDLINAILAERSQ